MTAPPPYPPQPAIPCQVRTAERCLGADMDGNLAIFSPLSLPEDASERCLRTFKVSPKPLQLEVARKIGQGEDCVLIAGCGWGKTLVYFLPLIFWPDRIIVVLTPLTALGKEQDQKLQAVDISSIFLRRETIIDSNCIKELASGKYRAVFMSPELVFDSTRLKDIWFNKSWRRLLLAVIVDEAHCINHWGDDFRKAYGRIGEIRRWLPPRKAFIALTATLTTKALEAVKVCLSYKSDIVVVNEGNDRRNVKYTAKAFCYPANSFQDLNFLLGFDKKTIVYFDSRAECANAQTYLRRLAPENLRKRIGVYHAGKSDERKELVMKRFTNNNYWILLATEAAGMGCDISDVVRVVQYGIPSSLSTLVQRIGRAARDPNLEGEGILLYAKTFPRLAQPTMDESHLQQYINAHPCRRVVLNRFFNNTPVQIVNCCDKCQPNVATPAQMGARLVLPSRKNKINISAKDGKQIRETIEQWRKDRFERFYRTQCVAYRVGNVLPDKMIDRIIKKFGSIKSAVELVEVADWSEDIAVVQTLWDVLSQLAIPSNEPPFTRIYDENNMEMTESFMAKEFGVDAPNSPVLRLHRIEEPYLEDLEELECPQTPTSGRAQEHPRPPTRTPAQRINYQLQDFTPTSNRQQTVIISQPQTPTTPRIKLVHYRPQDSMPIKIRQQTPTSSRPQTPAKILKWKPYEAGNTPSKVRQQTIESGHPHSPLTIVPKPGHDDRNDPANPFI
ncbi:P-loop containing nucleoside triphosphate hydrolase protein [Gamsiella multidivaricata]|uniref:P-loop containing nucleoside triphosphate hydrolase protein n=1 Tax=Gamsiella multidivaricata TaxID=101098 RepID=UPI0022209B60|nr:P-loop containing nucleoside triphosphate hydrolase protein [Gamsiella multidivaricata]KAI7818765.1 P-loop containing nucleoside triphosphate hydrolase protein [Gamsiella multidivaricata]